MLRRATIALAILFALSVWHADGTEKKKGKPKYTNTLAKEISPYLLMHAHNPTNWYPWGPEAFAKATREPSFSTEIGVFARAIGMPASLREIGLDRSRFDRFAEMAANDPGALANPRRLTSDDCRRILEAAW